MNDKRSANFPVSVLQRFLIGILLTFFILVKPNAQQCTGTSLNVFTSNPPRLNANDLTNGFTEQRYLTIHFSFNRQVYCRKWSMVVRATGNWRSGNNEIDTRNTSLRFNTITGGPTGGQIGVSNVPIPISLSETSLVYQSKQPLDPLSFMAFDMKYDLVIRGGGDQILNAPNGMYATNLVFLLYDEFGAVVTTTSARAQFQINQNAGGNNSSSVILQNGANNISLGFNNSADFISGVSDTKFNGLNVTAYSPHQIIVKASGNRLLAAGGGQGIPVSTIMLDLGTSSSFGAVSCYSVNLSANATIVADNPMPNRNYQNVPYTLKFSIAGNDPNITSAVPGAYNTSIVFIIVPK